MVFTEDGGFEIIFFGYLLGRVRIKGVSLGAAGVFIIALLFGVLYSTEIGQTVTQTVAGEKVDISLNTLKVIETTGLVLFSLTQEFQPAFDALVAGHDLRQCSLAIAAGTRRRWPDEVVAPIARDRHDARRMRVSASGKAAATLVRKLGEANGRSLLLAELETGRRHQIRVHLQSMGFPLAGDALYGGPRAAGLMLHALEEALLHPVTGERLTVRAPWPKRFERDFSARDYLPLVHT